MKLPGTYIVEACTRPVDFGDEWPAWLETHCYLRLVDCAGRTVDSISFSQTIRPDFRDTHEDDAAADCRVLRQVSKDEWRALREQARATCRTERFDLWRFNCCTCVADLATTSLDVALPDNIRRANGGRGMRQR